jgi:hypothetical protein
VGEDFDQDTTADAQEIPSAEQFDGVREAGYTPGERLVMDSIYCRVERGMPFRSHCPDLRFRRRNQPVARLITSIQVGMEACFSNVA